MTMQPLPAPFTMDATADPISAWFSSVLGSSAPIILDILFLVAFAAFIGFLSWRRKRLPPREERRGRRGDLRDMERQGPRR